MCIVFCQARVQPRVALLLAEFDLRVNPEVQTPLGLLRLGKGIGEGANALVLRAQWGRGHVAAKFLAEDCSGTP